MYWEPWSDWEPTAHLRFKSGKLQQKWKRERIATGYGTDDTIVDTEEQWFTVESVE